MSWRIRLVVLVIAATATSASERLRALTLEGDVVRQNGTPVARVPIVAVQRAGWQIFGPVADTKIARTVSDAAGHFIIQLPSGANVRRLTLVARGGWERMDTNNPKDIGLMGTSVPLEKVTEHGPNRIIVPNAFRPAK